MGRPPEGVRQVLHLRPPLRVAFASQKRTFNVFNHGVPPDFCNRAIAVFRRSLSPAFPRCLFVCPAAFSCFRFPRDSAFRFAPL